MAWVLGCFGHHMPDHYPLAHSASNNLPFFLLLKQSKHIIAPGLLHLLYMLLV